MKRPGSWTAFGVINLVFGGINILSCIFGIVSRLFMAPNPAVAELEKDPVYRAFTLVSMPLGGAIGVLLIIAGIGLLRFQPYGRTLSRVYGWIAIVMTLVGSAVMSRVMDVTMQQALKGSGMPQSAATAFVVVTMVLSVVLGLSYPILLLIFMRRDPRKALAEPAAREGDAQPDNPFSPPTRN